MIAGLLIDMATKTTITECDHSIVLAAGDHPCAACGLPMIEQIKRDAARRQHPTSKRALDGRH